MSTAIIGHITIDEIKFKGNGRKYLLCGGPPTYISSVLSNFTKPLIISTVGYDFPRFFISKISQRSRACIKRNDKRETTRFILIYDENYDREMYLLRKCSRIGWKQITECLTEDVENIIVSPVIGEISYRTVTGIRQEYKAKISLDAQGFVRRVEPNLMVVNKRSAVLERLLSKIDILKISLDEAQSFCKDNLASFVRKCLKRNPEMKVLLTLGRKGCLLASCESVAYIKPPEDIEVVDPTGAGDILLGVYSYLSVLKGFDDIKAITYAVAYASFSIEHVGPFISYSMSHIEKFREETTVETGKSLESIIHRIQ